MSIAENFKHTPRHPPLSAYGTPARSFRTDLFWDVGFFDRAAQLSYYTFASEAEAEEWGRVAYENEAGVIEWRVTPDHWGPTYAIRDGQPVKIADEDDGGDNAY